MKLQAALEKAWYGNSLWVWVLSPFAIIFGLLSFIRRGLYKSRVIASSKPPIPVIVVGNITVGGNGKTPVVIALAEFLMRQGYTVGVLSRGYKGSQKQFPHFVSNADSSASVGDEPMLMFNRLGCDVVIDPVRARGAKALYANQCTVIVCDDGLQHYALQRDIELVVMDQRQLGNQHLLPMGPLRERAWRLDTINMLICNGAFVYSGRVSNQVNMQLCPLEFVNVAEPSMRLSCEQFVKQNPTVITACAIGNPQRFYHTLNALGLELSNQLSFPDHHHFVEQDLPQSLLVMTEKDAVKCRHFAAPNWWYLKISAGLPDTFFETINNQLNELNINRSEIHYGVR